MSSHPEKQLLLRILNDLDLPEAGQWVLSGSGVLVMHGIKRDRPMGDVDIFVATRPWFEMLFAGIDPLRAQPWSVCTTDPADPARRCDPAFLTKTVHGLRVDVFSGWRRRGIGDIDLAFWMHNHELVEGVPCIPLQMLLDWKEQMGRAKDQTDIERIKEHLQGRAA